MPDCPNCAAKMEPMPFRDHYGRDLIIDICMACQGLWFDGTELLQLGPESTLALFRFIAEHGGTPRDMQATMACPHCRVRLVRGTDRVQDTIFHYARCPRDHGRFVTFFQFLRARQFVRALSRPEIDELRRRVRQVNCSNCGAAVDINRAAACKYCRTPLSMIDPDQMSKAVQALDEAVLRRGALDPTLPIRLAAARLQVERAFASAEDRAVRDLVDNDRGDDLVRSSLRALAKLFARN
jgi:Zn-finger nucleic acid-binding protein